MSQEHQRSSISVKQNQCREGRGSHSSIKIPFQSVISTQKRASRTSLGGQLFLCIIGSVLSFSICIWLTGFSQDVQWRKLLFASGAALCALLFATLAAQIMRKAKQSPSEVIIPNLAVRRSTIVKIPRKSMCESNLNQKESGSTSSQQLLNSIPKDEPTAMAERTPSPVPNV
ncbi:putative integral membrane protein [Acanthocheilonema viteae]